MAVAERKVVVEVTRTSDLSGVEGAEPFSIVVRGNRISLDLTPQEIDELLNTPVISRPATTDDDADTVEYADEDDTVGHVVYSLSDLAVAFGASPAAKSGAESDTGKVRAWARANGYTVGDRGRIHADILAAYAKANVPATA